MERNGKARWVLFGAIFAALGWVAWAQAPALAAKTYQFTGKVTGVRGDTIAVSHGLETLEFARGSGVTASRELRGLKVGDEVTIWYKLELQKAEPRHAPLQQPGQKAPEPSPQDVPGKEKQMILDDRAFYDA